MWVPCAPWSPVSVSMFEAWTALRIPRVGRGTNSSVFENGEFGIVLVMGCESS